MDSWQQCGRRISVRKARLLLKDRSVHCSCISYFSKFQCILLLQITINRPDKRNAFRPLTVKELMRAFNDARDDSSIGVIILTGKVTKKKKKKHAAGLIVGDEHSLKTFIFRCSI